MVEQKLCHECSAKGQKKRKRQELIFLVALLAVPTVHWFIFWLYVNMSSFTLAFKTQAGAWSLFNFQLFWQSFTSPYGTTVGRSLLNTLKYWTVSIGINFPLSICIAYFLFKKIRFYKFFRVVFFLPSIVTSIILVSVYNMAILPGGLWDMFLNLFGSSVPEWGYLNDKSTATNAILVYSVWTGFGSNVVLIGSAMARVPDSVLEAAKLDGCKPFREIVQIILPLIWPTLSTLILLSLTSFFSTSGPILLFAPDGNAGTSTLSYWIFKQVYGSGEFGQMGGTQNYGLVSATGLIFTVIWVPVILFVRWLMDKIPSVEY